MPITVAKAASAIIGPEHPHPLEYITARTAAILPVALESELVGEDELFAGEGQLAPLQSRERLVSEFAGTDLFRTSFAVASRSSRTLSS